MLIPELTLDEAKDLYGKGKRILNLFPNRKQAEKLFKANAAGYARKLKVTINLHRMTITIDSCIDTQTFMQYASMKDQVENLLRGNTFDAIVLWDEPPEEVQHLLAHVVAKTNGIIRYHPLKGSLDVYH